MVEWDWTKITPESVPEECRTYRRTRRVKSLIQRIEDMLDDLYYEHPTLCAALFTAAGAVLGAAGALYALALITMNII